LESGSEKKDKGMNKIIKLFEPIKVFEYSVAIVAVMVAAGATMWVAELLVKLIRLF
jgi:hypothetical protein